MASVVNGVVEVSDGGPLPLDDGKRRGQRPVDVGRRQRRVDVTREEVELRRAQVVVVFDRRPHLLRAIRQKPEMAMFQNYDRDH